MNVPMAHALVSVRLWGTFGPFPHCYARSEIGGLLLMSRVNEYRRFAAECLKMAQTAEDEQRRSILLQMAQGWLALAQKDETNTDRADGGEDEID
jgi:hypothetical protein